MTDLSRTGLFALHEELGAKLVPFAGWEMPVQYPSGVMGEHNWTREHAGLFDVGHMGQVILRGEGVDLALERLVGADVVGLGDGRQRYAVFTNDAGGILDDLMFARRGRDLYLVVNAACAEADISLLQAGMPGFAVEVLDRGLLALQGPEAEAALEALVPGVGAMGFMDHQVFAGEFGELWVSRSGYTGEDGYEVSLEADQADRFARALLADARVEMIGLGARDSLRLEAGLPLYGQDIDETTSPVEAGLGFAIGKARRAGGDREAGFPGADRILGQLRDGVSRKRVGLRPGGRAPMRGGVEIFESDSGGRPVGTVTSGGFGPSLGGPMAMAWVPVGLAEPGTGVFGEVRGKRLPADVVKLPFRAAGYKR